MDVDDAIGPAFDAHTLSTPTPRKLVGCWMDQAGLRTLIVPQVWDELTHQPPSVRQALDLESVLNQARRIAVESPALCIERLRAQCHGESRTAL